MQVAIKYLCTIHNMNLSCFILSKFSSQLHVQKQSFVEKKFQSLLNIFYDIQMFKIKTVLRKVFISKFKCINKTILLNVCILLTFFQVNNTFCVLT